MSAKKLSINKACVFLGLALLLAVSAATIILYKLTNSISAVFCCLLFCIFVLFCVICFVMLVRRKLTLFSDLLCRTLDDMLSGDIEPPQMAVEENLFYKINYRLGRLYEVMNENRRSIAKERADLQELISDISHQVKTPIANLKMINSTLMEQDVAAYKQKEFLLACASQLDKKKQPIYDTLASALGGILLNAENG